MKIGAIIQARTSSTRLPQKVLKPLPFNSKTNVLQQVIRRVSKSELIDEIIIATTTHDEDEKIVEVAKKETLSFTKAVWKMFWKDIIMLLWKTVWMLLSG